MTGANVQMKTFFLIALASCLALDGARADDTNGAAPAKIPANAAAKHYGENRIVTGRVAQVTIRPRAVFINLDKPYPDSPFAGVIFSRFTNGFSNLLSLSNQGVEISGVISNYQEKPEIILTNAGQLTVTGPWPGTEEETNPAAPVSAQAIAAAAPPPATPPGHPAHFPTEPLLWLAGLLAGGLALLLRFRKAARRSALQRAPALLQDPNAQAGAWMADLHTGQIIAAPPPESAAPVGTAPMPETVREGVIAHLTQWLKQHAVRRLLSDRADLLAAQQAAALKVLAVDERLAKIEHQIQERNQDYERRIDELLKALITAEAENREMIRAQITFLKTEMEKARLKARQQGEEGREY
jgi:hypothetical protein